LRISFCADCIKSEFSLAFASQPISKQAAQMNIIHSDLNNFFRVGSAFMDVNLLASNHPEIKPITEISNFHLKTGSIYRWRSQNGVGADFDCTPSGYDPYRTAQKKCGNMICIQSVRLG
jgi:hypothetical protein